MSHSDTDDQPESDDQSESDDQDTTGQVSKLSLVDSEDGPCSECDGKGKKPRKEKKSLRRLAEDGLLRGSPNPLLETLPHPDTAVEESFRVRQNPNLPHCVGTIHLRRAYRESVIFQWIPTWRRTEL
jgi:hypothetical protein